MNWRLPILTPILALALSTSVIVAANSTVPTYQKFQKDLHSETLQINNEDFEYKTWSMSNSTGKSPYFVGLPSQSSLRESSKSKNGELHLASNGGTQFDIRIHGPRYAQPIIAGTRRRLTGKSRAAPGKNGGRAQCKPF